MRTIIGSASLQFDSVSGAEMALSAKSPESFTEIVKMVNNAKQTCSLFYLDKTEIK